MDDEKNTNLENEESQEEQENIESTEQEENDESLEVEETEELEESQDEDTDKVPLATFLEQKKKLKVLERKIAEMEDSKFEDSIKAKKSLIRKKWIDKGFDEQTSEAIASEMAALYEEFGNVRQSRQDIIFETDIEELSADDFYSDIKDYKGQIKQKIKEFKQAGVSLDVKDAYLMVVGPTAKLRESKIDAEIKNSVSKLKTTSSNKANVATSSGDAKGKYKLSIEDQKNLKNLQKWQPEFKWTAKKYIESLNS